MKKLLYATLIISLPCFAMFQEEDTEELKPKQVITFMATHTKQMEIDAEMAFYDAKIGNLHQQMIDDWEAKHVGAKDLESRRERFKYRMAQDKHIRRIAALQNAMERADKRHPNPNVPQVVYSSGEFQGMRN